MTRLQNESGMTLIEMVVGMTLALIVFGLVLGVLSVFQSDSTIDQRRNETQANARSAIDRLAVDLRNVAAPLGGSTGALEQVGPYDVVFQTVNAAATSSAARGSNATGAMRVRYCLDNTTPSNEKLWRATQTWTTQTAPQIPNTASCPGTGWTSTSQLVSNVTNENNSQNRPMVTCQAAGVTSDTCVNETTNTSQVKALQVDLFLDLNPGGKPGETHLTGGIDLRNSLSAPTAGFTASKVNNNYVQLDGSGSVDPTGETLSYQWYQGNGCTSANAIAGATGEQYKSGYLAAGTYTFDLQVTNIGGLSSCAAAQTVTIS